MGHHPDNENPSWVKEKDKIKQLSFWDEVSSITGAADGKVWFLDPVGITLNFIHSNDCSTPLTIANLKEIATGISDSNAERYLNNINELHNNNIDTCLRRGHFLAQIIHESGSFRYTKELGDNLSYDPWRGRGLFKSLLKVTIEIMVHILVKTLIHTQPIWKNLKIHLIAFCRQFGSGWKRNL